MAIYHLSVKIGSRAKGQSAIAAAAYRSGTELTDHETGVVSDYSHKGGVVHSEIALCKNAPAEYADRQTLWDAVHKVEKAKNAQLWREFEAALPAELDRAEQIETVREFVRGLTDRGMCADWSLHDKGDGNPHAHIMTTMRSIEADGSWAAKSRKVYELDENGDRIFQKIDKTGKRQYKCRKEDFNDWNAKERVEEWRTAWEVCCNARLSAHSQIDHRSYARQGIDRVPTIHEGVAARQIAKKGGVSELVERNKEIRRANQDLQTVASRLKAVEIEITSVVDSVPQASCQKDSIPLESHFEDTVSETHSLLPTHQDGCMGERDVVSRSYAKHTVLPYEEVSPHTQTDSTDEKVNVLVERITKLRDKYILRYAVLSYLQSHEYTTKLQDEAKRIETGFAALQTISAQYQDVQTQLGQTKNPFKKRSLTKQKQDMAEQAAAQILQIEQDAQMWVLKRESAALSEHDISAERLHGAMERVQEISAQYKVSIQDEQQQNAKIMKMRSFGVTVESMEAVFRVFLDALRKVPKALCERVKTRLLKKPLPKSRLFAPSDLWHIKQETDSTIRTEISRGVPPPKEESHYFTQADIEEIKAEGKRLREAAKSQEPEPDHYSRGGRSR